MSWSHLIFDSCGCEYCCHETAFRVEQACNICTEQHPPKDCIFKNRWAQDDDDDDNMVNKCCMAPLCHGPFKNRRFLENRVYHETNLYAVLKTSFKK